MPHRDSSALDMIIQWVNRERERQPRQRTTHYTYSNRETTQNQKKIRQTSCAAIAPVPPSASARRTAGDC